MTFKPHSLRQEIDLLSREQQLPILLITFAFWLVCAVEWAQRFVGEIPDPRFWTLVSLVVTLYSGFRIFRLRARPIASGRSSRNEMETAFQRIRSRGFVAFHDLPGNGRNIDHVVVGPAGIYTMEIKARSGSGTIDCSSEDELIFAGRIKDGRALRCARRSAEAIQSYLDQLVPNSYTVKPLLVFLGNWEVQHSDEQCPVDVTTAGALLEYFDKQQPQLTGNEITRISSYFESAAAA